VQLGGVHVARARQRPDRAGGQRRQLHPPGAALRGQVAEDQPERVIVGDLVVPVGGHDQGRAAAEPPAEVAQKVDGGFVGPVHVLHHRDRGGAGRPGADLGQERGKQPVPWRAGLAGQAGQLPARLGGDVEQRAERPRGHQPLAAAPQPAQLR
jgi:hypothetical protein